MNSSNCSHDHTIPGIDGDWCLDCQRLIFPQASAQNQAIPPRSRSGPRVFEQDALGLDTPLFGAACGNIDDEQNSPLTESPALPSKPGGAACGSPESAAKAWHLVQLYRSHGSLYYRYIHGRGHRVDRYVHIPGGNTDNPIAAARREQVDRWIRQNQPPDTIVKMIARWK